jgi:hypothetical protein
MDWSPISETKIWDKINASFERMSPEQKKLWEVIKIIPEKWQQDPWGNAGKGFWAVAIIGNTVIWFNDIEDGFNRSTFNEYGKIGKYSCDQDDLEWTIQYVINQIRGS